MNIDFRISEIANILHIMDMISGFFEEAHYQELGSSIKNMYKELFPESKIDEGPLANNGKITDRGYLVTYNSARWSIHLGNNKWLGVFLSAKSIEEAIQNAIPEHLFPSFQQPIMHFKGNILRMYLDNKSKLMKRRGNLQERKN